MHLSIHFLEINCRRADGFELSGLGEILINKQLVGLRLGQRKYNYRYIKNNGRARSFQIAIPHISINSQNVTP
jgi:hypothetical protein